MPLSVQEKGMQVLPSPNSRKIDDEKTTKSPIAPCGEPLTHPAEEGDVLTPPIGERVTTCFMMSPLLYTEIVGQFRSGYHSIA